MLILIRHGQSEANASGHAQGGELDPNLTEQGKKEALMTAKFIK